MLAFMILLSSSGITYAQHFCLGHVMLARVTLGEVSMSCGMGMEKSPCGDETEATHGCCDNHYLNIDTDEHFAKVSFDFEPQVLWVAVLPDIPGMPEDLEPAANYDSIHVERPPPDKRPLRVLYQTFLL